MFAELLGRSCFSFLRGGSHPEELLSRADELQLPFTLCDFEGLYGAVRGYSWHKARVGEGGTPPPYSIGAEVLLEAAMGDSKEDALSLALLVESSLGYENVCRILSAAAHSDGPSLVSWEMLEGCHEGLVALLVPPSEVRHLPPAKAQGQLILRLQGLFGRNLFLASYRHLDGRDAARQRWVERISKAYGIFCVATARPSYHVAERKPLTDVLQCIRRGITLNDAGSSLAPNAEQFVRSEAQMLHLFRDRPDWVHQSGEIAQRLKFSFRELSYKFPCSVGPHETADERLAELTWEGVGRRYPLGVTSELRAQIKKELALIRKIQVASYFLSTCEIVEIARRRKILCQGRGSAANSAVCFALGITAVDPSRSKLLFERFLSEERAEPPDIDIDFEHERREEVIQEIYERYGRERAAMVSEVICYRGKSALGDVGKVFGLNPGQLEKLKGLLGWGEEADDERLIEAGFDIHDPGLSQVIAIARELQGFPRHLSIHVGGFVLSSEPLYRIAPVQPARMEGRTVIPWDKDDIDALGFFKVDVLGLGMLTAMRKSLELIRQSGGLEPPRPVLGTSPLGQAERPHSDWDSDPLEWLARIPAEDQATYDMICKADTVGVFQIESRAQMAMLPRLRPRCFYDLVIEVALVRPGPIQGGMVHPYLRRRNNEEAVQYPHPALEGILKRTLGVPLFQEQVMQIAIEGAGYSGGQADQLRRDMAAWKKHGRLEAHRDRLMDGFLKKGIKKSFSEALFEQMRGFGEYGFPESHASSFALLVYASSWLKAHYPAHFACALLNSQPMGFYAPTTIVRDAQRHRVKVHDVSLLKSSWDSELVTPEVEEQRADPGSHREIQLGFQLIKGLKKGIVQQIVLAREQRPFSSLEDLQRRVPFQKGELELLAEAGALECLGLARREALWRARAPQTPGLFAELEPNEPAVSLAPLRASEQLLLDYEHKGLSVDDHPCRHYRKRLQKAGAVRAVDLSSLAQRTFVYTGGLALTRQRPPTAGGIVFVTLEDETGFINLLLHPPVFERYRGVLQQHSMLWVEGTIERDRPLERASESPAVIHVLVQSLEPLREKLGGKAGSHKVRQPPKHFGNAR